MGNRRLVGTGGAAVSSARPVRDLGQTPNARVRAGGVPWVGQCVGINMKTKLPCENAPINGDNVCIGHRRAAEARTRKEQ